MSYLVLYNSDIRPNTLPPYIVLKLHQTETISDLIEKIKIQYDITVRIGLVENSQNPTIFFPIQWPISKLKDIHEINVYPVFIFDTSKFPQPEIYTYKPTEEEFLENSNRLFINQGDY